MNFETVERRAIDMLNTSKTLLTLAEKEGGKESFLSTSIVLSAMAIEAYTNALIWLRIIEKDDQQLLEEYTCVKRGERELKRKSIKTKVEDWTESLTGKSFGTNALIEKFNDLIKLRNKIVHYQIKKLNDKQLEEFRKNTPYHLVNKGEKVKDWRKINQSIRESFFHDYLATKITLKRTQEAIETTREVMAELNKCYYNFIPWWLK